MNWRLIRRKAAEHHPDIWASHPECKHQRRKWPVWICSALILHLDYTSALCSCCYHSAGSCDKVTNSYSCTSLQSPTGTAAKTGAGADIFTGRSHALNIKSSVRPSNPSSTVVFLSTVHSSSAHKDTESGSSRRISMSRSLSNPSVHIWRGTHEIRPQSTYGKLTDFIAEV